MPNTTLLTIHVFHCLGTKQGDGKYKHTVDLPKTTFGMRANSSVSEPEIQKLWDENQVFKKVSEKNNGVSFGNYSSSFLNFSYSVLSDIFFSCF